MTKERPILFSAPMVRSILAGTKTQTRRVVRPQPEWTSPDTVWDYGEGHSGTGWYAYHGDYPEEGSLHYRRPYGQPGDRLWVREAHWWFKDEPDHSCGYYPPKLTAEDVEYRADGDDGSKVWRPSIHMPRWASRITLEITGVRVERLQGISAEDAKAEGAWPDVSVVGDCADYFGIDVLAVNPRRAFQMLWERINGPESWSLNPFVWVVEFKRMGLAP